MGGADWWMVLIYLWETIMWITLLSLTVCPEEAGRDTKHVHTTLRCFKTLPFSNIHQHCSG